MRGCDRRGFFRAVDRHADRARVRAEAQRQRPARVLAGELCPGHGLHQRLFDDVAARDREVSRRGGAGMEPGRGQLPWRRPPDDRDRDGDGGGRRPAPSIAYDAHNAVAFITGGWKPGSSRRSPSRRCSRAPTAASSTPTCRSTPSGAGGRTSIRVSIRRAQRRVPLRSAERGHARVRPPARLRPHLLFRVQRSGSAGRRCGTGGPRMR